ncbi:MAG TPA: RDD family protein [Baekduia sp.]|uniref:RDD family protein n=1 Tax=Baekduia sp. TaxID=2600305 RepID=UPI002BB014F1|nr:RDD family protein [Baekduia sp.]HMJ33411.1 RDD family protein [Baekduia sp.]
MTDQTFAPPAPAGAVTDARAGFWIRFGAAIVDGLLLGIVSSILQIAMGASGYALSLLVGVAYYTYFEGESGQTIGKRAVGIRVVDIDGGGPIGYGRAFIRYVGRIISTLVVFLGYLWMLWDPQKQTWHDKMANSVVVPQR